MPNKGDLEQLEQLIRGRHPCIAVTTNEEEYVLGLIRDAIVRTPYMLNIWSINGGIRDGLLIGHPPAPETEHPAAALFYLLRQPGGSLNVFLDLGPHLRDERTLRLLRDFIGQCRASGGQIILIDCESRLPSIIESLAARFEIALPDEEEIELIIRGVIRRMNEKEKVQADIGKRAFQVIVRNLRGLSRNQIEQIVLETVAGDLKFDADDLHTILAPNGR